MTEPQSLTMNEKRVEDNLILIPFVGGPRDGFWRWMRPGVPVWRVSTVAHYRGPVTHHNYELQPLDLPTGIGVASFYFYVSQDLELEQVMPKIIEAYGDRGREGDWA